MLSQCAVPSVPDHELLRCIGRGAYGEVWLARNVMGTHRAVKIVPVEPVTHTRPLSREYEGLLKYEPISRSHPNLMQILHVGHGPRCFYYVTELADDVNADSGAPGVALPVGESARFDPGGYVPHTLREDLERRQRLPVRECLKIAVALASALKHLHDHKLVHRDVKPSNVIFVHGVPKLADIGLVTTVGDSHSVVGTEGYLPPEGPGSAPGDIYSLGRLLYEISTGMNRRDYPRLPPNLRELPDAKELLEFNEVLLQACANDIARRYRDADSLLADLALLERGDSVLRLRRLERHHVMLKRLGAGVLVLGLLLFGAWWQSWRMHRIASRHLAELHVHEGTQRMLQGDYTAALPWLVGALQLDGDNAASERAHRTRIAGVLEQFPLPVARFSGSESEAWSADFSPDDTLVATAHESGLVQLWDKRSGKPVRRMSHSFPVVLCRFDPAGEHLLTLTLDQKIHLWDLKGPGSAPVTLTHCFRVDGSSYSLSVVESPGAYPTGTYLGKGHHRLIAKHPAPEQYANLTLGLTLIGQGADLLVRYEIRRTRPDGQVLCQGEFRDSPEAEGLFAGRDEPPAPVMGKVLLCLLDDPLGNQPGERGQIIWDELRVRSYASGARPGPWRVVDDFSGGELSSWFQLAAASSRPACQVRNGTLIVSYENLPLSPAGWTSMVWMELFPVSGDRTLQVEADVLSVQAPHPNAGLAISRPDLGPLSALDIPLVQHGRWVPLIQRDGTIQIWDLQKQGLATPQTDGHRAPLRLQDSDFVRSVDLRPDAQVLASVTRTEQLTVWDLKTGLAIIPDSPMHPGVTGARFSPDGRFLAVSHRDGLELIGTRDWRLTHTLESGVAIGSPCFSPRGSRLAAVRGGREIVVWDLGDLSASSAGFPHHHYITGLSFSPDGRYLACRSTDGMVQLWDLARGERFGPPLPGGLRRFSADGSQMLTLDARGDVWLWDLSRVNTTLMPVPPLPSDQPSASSADQRSTARIRGSDILLRTPEGQFALAVPGSTSLRRVAFSADGRYLFADGADMRSWIWDVATRTLAVPPRPARYEATLQSHSGPNLPVENRDWRMLSEWAALLARQQPDGQGGMVPNDPGSRARLFDKLRKAHPAEFVSDPAHLAAWHGAQAGEAERAMAWDTAVFHWEAAVKRNGARPSSESAFRELRPEVPLELRLAYARQAAAVHGQALFEGRSRWSVILPRQPWAATAMLDLTSFYNRPLGDPGIERQSAAAFRELAGGVHVLGGLGFDARGIIHLGLTNAVTIPVGRPCQRIHFLHAASQAIADLREAVGTYRVLYANGATASTRLFNPEDVQPYCDSGYQWVSALAQASPSPNLRSVLRAWSGSQPGLAGTKRSVFLTHTTWELPEDQRGEPVVSLELRAGISVSDLLVFAITVEPVE
ncbi:MAG: protein kinase [Verrucomicrobia bacterium]|nr:protein kinase [Verrucomicrobiota bacterium]